MRWFLRLKSSIDRNAIRIAQAVFLGTLAVSTPSAAWQSDFHYGLTKWLAIQAGFSNNAAEQIAEGNLGLDHGMSDAIEQVVRSACMKPLNEGDAREVEDKHFPAAEGVPSLFQKRVVVGGSERAARTLAKLPSDPCSDQSFFKRYGAALHPYQDSWSHQGTPHFPGFCDPKLAWGHPVERGAYWCTRADQTAFWEGDTIAAAKGTFGHLRKLNLALSKLKRNKECAGALQVSGPPARWEDIAGKVKDFANRKTKTAKREWFKSVNITDTEFLAATTLPDGAQSFDVNWVLKRMNVAPLVGVFVWQDVSAEVAAFFGIFMKAWFQGEGMEHFLDLEAIVNVWNKRSKHCAGVIKPEYVATIMRRWMDLADHGSVLGIVDELFCLVPPGDCKEAKDALDNLAKQPFKRDLAKFFKSVDEALVPLSGPDKGTRNMPYGIVPLPNGQFLAIGQFRHTPNDFFMLTAAPKGSGKEWKIVNFSWWAAN